MTPMTKTCKMCEQDLPLSSFGKDGGANYLRYACKTCEKQQARLLREIKKTAPPIPHDHHCPICGRDAKTALGVNTRRKSPWCADHDHKTNMFRGWICHKCNLGLGNFDDSMDRLEGAMRYLRKDMEDASRQQ
jgi:hypothetical protein